MSALNEWDSFYVIVGGAAGALIGLQFVVMTLVAEKPASPEGGAAFATPTIMLFSIALLISAVMRAPWHGVVPPAATCGLVGLFGVIYTIVVIRRMRHQRDYRPQLSDWCFFVLLPMAAYAALCAAAVIAPSHEQEGMFAVGGAALLLLFVGIHNSWDSIAYHVLVRRKKETQR